MHTRHKMTFHATCLPGGKCTALYERTCSGQVNTLAKWVNTQPAMCRVWSGLLTRANLQLRAALPVVSERDHPRSLDSKLQLRHRMWRHQGREVHTLPSRSKSGGRGQSGIQHAEPPGHSALFSPLLPALLPSAYPSSARTPDRESGLDRSTW